MNRYIIASLVFWLITSIIGGYIGGSVALRKFERNHTTMTIFEPDAQYYRDNTKTYGDIME